MNRIQDLDHHIELGDVLQDDVENNWVYIGRSKRHSGNYEYYFVRENMISWTYKCDYYETLQKKFPSLPSLEELEELNAED